LCSLLSNEEQQNPLAGANYLFAHSSEDKGQKRHNREGVFHGFAFLVCSRNLLFLLPAQRTAQRAVLFSGCAASNKMKSGLLRTSPIQVFSAREVLISSSLPPSNGTRVVLFLLTSMLTFAVQPLIRILPATSFPY
jgi:hypothetical protein